MRLLFGIILGAAITVGAAYLHDSIYAASVPNLPGVAARPIVNWDVAGELARNATRRARQQIDRLTGK